MKLELELPLRLPPIANRGDADSVREDQVADDEENARRLAANVASLRASWASLTRTAHYLARQSVDADDLLAVAVAATWEKWATGTGPVTHIAAYITQSMRNRMIDHFRSPHSDGIPLETLVHHPEYVDDVSRIDHHADDLQLRATFGRLPSRMQQVLVDVVINGRKPRDLESQYSLSAPEISTAVYRAKKMLRHQLFLSIVHESCGKAECAPRQAEGARGLEHAASIGGWAEALTERWECQDCLAGVYRYVEMSGRAVS